MSYYRVCPRCGAHLDPGEVCDCQTEKNTPASAANAGEGGAEHVDDDVSASNDTKSKEDLQP